MPTKQELLADYSASIKYYQAHLCSCVKGNHGVYDPEDNCFYGWRYENPVTDTIIGMEYKLYNGNFENGSIYEGECKFLIFDDSSYFSKVGKGDLIVSTDLTIKKSCLLDVNGSNMVPDFDVIEVSNVSSLTVTYTEDTDYSVAEQDGKSFIVWLAGGSAPERYYSVEYIANVNFCIWDVLPALESTNASSTYKSVTCKLRKFGFAPLSNIVDTMNFSIAPEEYINI